MKLCVLIFWSLLLSGTLAAQESGIYFVKNEGKVNPEIIVAQDEHNTTVQLDIESFSSERTLFNGDAEKITLTGGIGIMEKGLPDIQHLATAIAINPIGKTNLIINNAEYIDYPSFNISPSAGDPGLYESSALIPDSEVYNLNSFWPSTVAMAGDPYIIGSTRGISIHFYPVQFNPVTHVLRVYHHISVSVEYLDEAGVNEVTRTGLYNNTPMQNIIGDHFANEIPSTSSDRYTVINEEQGKMLVIAHPSFLQTMQPFVQWKNQKGIKCEIVDVTSLGGADQIKEFISEYYYNYGLTYLLLVGDAAYVPSNMASKGLSDITYGYISGDDHYPEILVGRFPCETVDQCRIMVERTINYEKNPSVKADFNNFLGIGSGLGPGDDGELDYEHIRNIAGLLNPPIYPDFNEMYDGSRGGNDLDGNPTTTMTAEAINKGQGAIMYIGHGSINSWLTTGFSTTSASHLENTETHPFIWAAGCNNGQFNDATCLAEGLLRASKNGEPTGAIAALMSSTNQTWYPPMEAQDEIALLLRNTDNNPASTFGGVSLSGCMKMNDKYGKGAYVVTDNWILFGDPSVELRTATAMDFHPVLDTIIGIDANEFIVSSIPDGAFVCVTNNESIISTATAENGRANLQFIDIKALESLTITITGKNYRPYIKNITTTKFPSMAINPSPADHSFKVPTSLEFNWDLSSGCEPEYFTWFVREKGVQQWETQDVNYANELNIPRLGYLTTYEWKVITHNGNGSTESKIFDFTTIESPDEDFEQGNFPRNNWSNSQSWYVDNSESYEGNFSLHSGSTVSRESSSLFYECETLTCDVISFWLKQNIQDQASSIGFYMDDFLIAQWNNTINWTNFTYQIEPGNHTFEWRFSGSGDSSSVNSAAWIDNIYLPVNEPLRVSSLSQSICPASSVQLQPEVSNYASLKWETMGTGYFDDPYKFDALYFPSQEELQSETINLMLSVIPNNVCQTEIYNYVINVDNLPEFIISDDTTIYLNESINLELASNAVNQYVIYNDQTISTNLEIDQAKLVPGENTITIVAENSNGCSVEKTYSINLISSSRPAERSLTVYPNPSTDILNIVDASAGSLSNINIYRPDGQLVGQYDFNGANKASIPVNHLDPGLYIITSESTGTVTTSRFIKI